MFSSNKIKVIVCQRGARHRYTVPQIFEKADALSALYTDSSAYSTCGRIAYLLYRLGFRNQCITKLRKRTISHVALNKIFSKDIWSDIFINKYKTYESSVDALAPFFIKWGVQNANIIYSMNTDDYPFLVYAKKMGLKIIVDPCVSPLSHQILYDEYKMLNWGINLG